jgi:hypothetical protein
MATFGGDKEGRFKEGLLMEIQYQREEQNLSWHQAIRLVIAVLAHITQYYLEAGNE